MTIRLAAPIHALKPRMSAEMISGRLLNAANDNGLGRLSDPMLHAALRHFSQHGLAAAHSARNCAENALSEGDGEGFRWWLDICRTLDRRMARDLAARTSGAA